ncbi:MAG: chemotaxis protein CheW [Spirochaetaceae bacterium]|jgi:purine-binding chemotaxis protein CheW|nr:chemotaxis protein CheW [Spirochaetaceae bacterium]
MAVEIKDLAQVAADLQEQKERGDTVDFKMVTFSLAGKDYGVDIMNVKEIAKADKFTFVPNAASFVRGVYNLRGDIIPIIDLRTFFHVPTDIKNDGLENMLILHIEDRVYGTIVDKIDKVVGINTEAIQPPHPIFGDINIKFISGVVEKEGDLYIILDVVRIFSQNKEEDKARAQADDGAGSTFYAAPQAAAAPAAAPAQPEASESDFNFVRDGLGTLKHFYASALNNEWLTRRFSEWTAMRSGADIQLHNANDGDEFLATFYSPDTGAFWSDEYAYNVKGMLPDMPSNNIQVWNLGCGKGYETFSLACILKSRYPQAHLKIWANDNDIMAISSAANMIYDLDEVPEYARSLMVKGKNGYSFNQEIKEAVVFEYHDVLNGNQIPQVDIIIVRDLLSFVTVQDQERLIAEFAEKLKKRGVIFVGRNEQLPTDDWQPLAKDPISAFIRN